MKMIIAATTVALLGVAGVAIPTAAAAQPVAVRPAAWPTVNPRGAAQAVLDSPATQASLALQPADARITTLLAGGAAAAGLSAALGAVIGYQVTRHEGGEDPGLNGLAGGWLAGPALVTPLIVHILNDGRGSLPLSYTLAAGIVLASAVTIDAPVLFITSPALQAIAATITQRSTSR